jgi:serine/threonine-protein kinase
VTRYSTASPGIQLSPLEQSGPVPHDNVRTRARAEGSSPHRVAVGTSPPGKAAPRRIGRPNSRVGSQLAGYHIEERLGSGGTSVVYLARPADGGAGPLALKVLRRRFAADRDMAERFEQEAALLVRVQHPGLPRVCKAGRTRDGLPYVAMERLSGCTLGERLDRGPMSVGAIIDVALQAADVLVAVHAAGIVHCDLKPDNVFLVRDLTRRSRYRAMVIDFGVASAPAPDAGAAPRRVIGTPSYMAPEQIQLDGAVDERTDVYGFGCLLYEMLCGEPPFGGNVAEILAGHQKAPPAAPGSLRLDTPPALDALVLSMLAKNPTERPPTMATVLAALSAMATPAQV